MAEELDGSIYAPAGSEIALNMIGANVIDDGKDFYVAEVIVTNNNAPVEGVTVFFQLLDDPSAIFDSNQSTQISGITDSNGKVSEKITDTMAEEVEIHVYIKFIDGTKKTINKEFTFIALEPDKVSLTLNKNNVVIGRTNAITATATVTRKDPDSGKDVPLPQTLIHFSLPDSDAYFTDSQASKDKDGYSVTQGYTDANGVIAKSFVDLKWEEGEVHAYFHPKDNSKADVTDSKEFIFIAPDSVKVNFDATLQCTARYENKYVKTFPGHVVAADGEDSFSATVSVTDDSDSNIKKPLENIEVVFSLPPQMAVVDVEDSNNNRPWEGNQVTIFTGADGRATCPQFACNAVTKGLMSAMVFTPGKSFDDTAPFTFTVPWQGVSELSCQFSGGIKKAEIFANGLHQALLRIRMVLTKEEDILLEKSNQPTLDEVTKNIVLIDYQTRTPLGTGNLVGWGYSRTGNIYDKHLPGNNMQEAEIIFPDDPWQDRVENGVAYISYYITCDADATLKVLQLGLAVSPSGADGNVLYNATHGDFGDQSVQIVASLQRVYTAEDMDITSVQANNSFSPDPYATKDVANLYRQWDYQVRLRSTDGTSIFRCLVDDASSLVTTSGGISLPFSRRSQLFYNYAAYFWPNNVQDINGVDLPTKNNYRMQIGDEASRVVNIPDKRNDTLYFTYYATFGNTGAMDDKCTNGSAVISSDGYLHRAINITVYDQFGNKGILTVDPRTLPSRYNKQNISGYKMFTTGHVTGIDSYNYGHFPGTLGISSFKESNVVDYYFNYDDINGNNFRQLGSANADASLSYFTISKTRQGDNGIVLKTLKDGLPVFGISYDSTSFASTTYPAFIYSTKTGSTKDQYIYLYPVWGNNSIVIGFVDSSGGLQGMTLRAAGEHLNQKHNSDFNYHVYGYVYPYPLGNAQYEFIIQTV